MDLTEAEDIKKRWQECTEELYKKDFHDSDNHDGVITHLELEILECKRVLGIMPLRDKRKRRQDWAGKALRLVRRSDSNSATLQGNSGVRLLIRGVLG